MNCNPNANFSVPNKPSLSKNCNTKISDVANFSTPNEPSFLGSNFPKLHFFRIFHFSQAIHIFPHYPKNEVVTLVWLFNKWAWYVILCLIKKPMANHMSNHVIIFLSDDINYRSTESRHFIDFSSRLWWFFQSTSLSTFIPHTRTSQIIWSFGLFAQLKTCFLLIL